MPGQPCTRIGPGTRCHEHATAWQQLRNADRPIAKAVIATSPHCTQCGHPGSPANPLTADHVIPLARRPRNDGTRQTLCRNCNRAKGTN